MPTPADTVVVYTSDSDRRKSSSVVVTPSSIASTNSNPNPAADAGMVPNNVVFSTENYYKKQSAVNSEVQLSESDINTLVFALYEERQRKQALQILSDIASYRPLRAYDLAPRLWNTPSIVFILLKEVMSAYSILDNDDSLRITVGRVVDAICLLQSIAMHSGLKILFVKALIPAYVYPFIRLRETSPSIEKLRISSLGIIGALVKIYDSEVVHYLLDSEVFPCCLCSLEFGNQFARTVVAFVIFKLLSSEKGMVYCYGVPERFLSVLQVFLKIVEQTSQLNDNSIKLFRYVVGSYLAFAEVPRACGYLRSYFPPKFSNVHFLMQLGKADPKLYGDLFRLRGRIDEEVTHLGIPAIGFCFDSQ